MHGGMDILTLGLWELVGTPVEAVQGQEFEMTVTYGPDEKARRSRPVESPVALNAVGPTLPADDRSAGLVPACGRRPEAR
jgi:hypothetical protein